ncbi:MAG: redoxin domain-containing protein [Prevotella sp.]|nr:redoxin domain-containing protein [Prevotella sp.]
MMMRILSLLAFALMVCGAKGQTATATQDLDAKYATGLLPVGTLPPDLIDALGEKHPIADFHGRCVVLDFFATWCGDCRKDMPEVKKLYQKYDMEGVEFIGISFDTNSEVLQNFMDKEPIPWRVLSELKKMKESQMAKDYHIQWIPTMYLLDTEGRIVLATVEINKLKAKLAELKKSNMLVAPELAGQDHAPQYPGGVQALMKFLSSNIKYPVEAEHYGVEGRVLINFVVETDGTVSDAKVVNTELKNRLSDKKFSKYSDIDKYAMREQGEGQLKEEALRVVGMMPHWEPAMRRGQSERVRYTLPISFKLK